MSPADPAPSTHIWPSTHGAFPEGIQNLCGIFRNHRAGVRENCQWGYSGAVFYMKFHFVSMFLLPFHFPHVHAHADVHTHKHKCDMVQGQDVACAFPSSTCSESCEVGSGIHAVSWHRWLTPQMGSLKAAAAHPQSLGSQV